MGTDAWVVPVTPHHPDTRYLNTPFRWRRWRTSLRRQVMKPLPMHAARDHHYRAGVAWGVEDRTGRVAGAPGVSGSRLTTITSGSVRSHCTSGGTVTLGRT